jgi:hypothetical protein
MTARHRSTPAPRSVARAYPRTRRRLLWSRGALTASLPCALVPWLWVAAGCGGGSGADRQRTLDELRAAVGREVVTPGDRQMHDALVVRVVETGALEGMTRGEVMAVIGRGRPCSESALCADRGYEGDDWIYDVGRDPRGGVARLPTLIVGFDRTGRVDRTSYITR